MTEVEILVVGNIWCYGCGMCLLSSWFHIILNMRSYNLYRDPTFTPYDYMAEETLP